MRATGEATAKITKNLCYIRDYYDDTDVMIILLQVSANYYLLILHQRNIEQDKKYFS